VCPDKEIVDRLRDAGGLVEVGDELPDGGETALIYQGGAGPPFEESATKPATAGRKKFQLSRPSQRSGMPAAYPKRDLTKKNHSWEPRVPACISP
jgi:hypothetical protein